MNNETIKKINITIELRGDNVYYLYVDNKLVASHCSYFNIAEEAKEEIERCVIKLENSKYQSSEERCVCCGEVIPEGRQVCKRCEMMKNEENT